MNIGILSSKYEGGGIATISTGDGDSGGISYGSYQLATNTGSVASFVSWLQSRTDYGKNYGDMLARNAPGSLEFSADWLFLANNDPEGFAALETEYILPSYYYPACDVAKEYDVDTDNMPFALQCVLFSNAIQHGNYWGGRLIAESYNPDPAIWIANVYNTKLTDISWSNGAPTLRPGLFARWESERDDAIALL